MYIVVLVMVNVVYIVCFKDMQILRNYPLYLQWHTVDNIQDFNFLEFVNGKMDNLLIIKIWCRLQLVQSFFGVLGVYRSITYVT